VSVDKIVIQRREQKNYKNYKEIYRHNFVTTELDQWCWDGRPWPIKLLERQN